MRDAFFAPWLVLKVKSYSDEEFDCRKREEVGGSRTMLQALKAQLAVHRAVTGMLELTEQ